MPGEKSMIVAGCRRFTFEPGDAVEQDDFAGESRAITEQMQSGFAAVEICPQKHDDNRRERQGVLDELCG